MSVARSDRHAKHARAVANTLRMADEAAERGDYHEALSWLETVQAIGERLPDEYQHKHTAWRSRTGPPQGRCPVVDPIGDAVLAQLDDEEC